MIADNAVDALWAHLRRLACEEALARQLRHDKAVRRQHYRKRYRRFGAEKDKHS